MKQDEENSRPPAKSSTPRYEPPVLKKYGSLAELTRSGVGTAMETGKGPPRSFT